VRLAAGAVLSGPAGGVAGGRYCSHLLKQPDLITFDMGGTSTDISTIMNGEPPLAVNRSVAGHRVSLPSLDIVTLGAGGGSIAWVDKGGILQVGPHSAGAQPGPACYGRGGREVTVTDANLVMGYLNPGNFLGGETRLDVKAATEAVDRLATCLGIDRMGAARGVYEVVNTRMAEGIRLISVRRGFDPRGFALLSFGGAAGLHITDVARKLEIGRVVIPRLAPVLSAWGMLASDLRCEIVRTHIGEAHQLSAAELEQLFLTMEREGKERLGRGFHGRTVVQRALDMRYGQQIFEITVSLDGLQLTAAGALGKVTERFHRRHEELYTYSMREEDPLVVNARVTVKGELSLPLREPALARRKATVSCGSRRIYVRKWQQVPVFKMEDLAPAQSITGPAVVEAETTTVLLGKGDRAEVTRLGWLDIRVL
jgi:N-methylhydantoinase A